MALNFPDSPTDGQLYTDPVNGNRYTYDSANSAWKSTSTFQYNATVSSTAPGTPQQGSLWWNQDYGRLLVYYQDANTSQWVDATPSMDYRSDIFAVANAGFGKANTALQNTSGTLNGTLTIAGGNATINGSINPWIGFNDGTNGVSYLQIAGGVTSLYAGGSQPITLNTAGQERLRVNPTGGVGIGSGIYNTVAPLTVTNVGKQFTLQSYAGTQNNTVSMECIRADLTTNASVLAVYTNNGSGEVDRLRIDSAGKIGVGIQSPAYKVSIGGYVNANSINKVSIGDYASYQALMYYNSGDEGFTIENTSVYAGGSINFRTNSTERLRIDLNGRVLTPAQPYIAGYFAFNSSGSVSTMTLMPIASLSSRGGLSVSSNQVTVPVAGAYEVSMHTCYNNNGNENDIFIYKNGGFIAANFGSQSSGSLWVPISLSTIINCAANDYINFYYRGYFYGSSSWSAWSIKLLG